MLMLGAATVQPQTVDTNSDERISFEEFNRAFSSGGVQQLQVGASLFKRPYGLQGSLHGQESTLARSLQHIACQLQQGGL